MNIMLDKEMVYFFVVSLLQPDIFSSQGLYLALDHYNFRIGLFPHGGFIPLFDLLTNSFCGDLLKVFRSGIICNDFDEMMMECNWLVDKVLAKLMAGGIEVFMSLQFLFDLASKYAKGMNLRFVKSSKAAFSQYFSIASPHMEASSSFGCS
jgi:hypothetical protein